MHYRHHAAFTLIEVIVALAVFIIGIVALFPLVSGALTVMADMQTRAVVADLARSTMAELEAHGFQDAPADISATAFPPPYARFSYEIHWTPLMNDIASPGQAVLQQAELVISWQARGGRKEESFRTNFARFLPYP